ncbi:hypothetical protein GOV12_04315 [Candidatus Pacearchaeota archaeon]|nr:hypothetical protein [Candidatus Pacearchaeota archaeon]
MEKKYLMSIATIVFITLLIIPSIFAVTTNLKVKTMQQSKLFLVILETGEIYNVLFSSNVYNKTGIGELNYEIETTAGYFDAKLTLKNNNLKVLEQRLEQIYGGGDVTINFIPGEVEVSYNNETDEVVSNTTANETNTNNTNASAGITAAATSENNNSTTPTTPTTPNATTNTTDIDANASNPESENVEGKKSIITFNINLILITGLIVLVVLVIIIFLIILLVYRSKNKSKGPNPSSSIKFRPKKDPEIGETQRELQSAERKLKEAKEEIDKIKKRNDLISEAERKLSEDKQRLEKLKMNY